MEKTATAKRQADNDVMCLVQRREAIADADADVEPSDSPLMRKIFKNIHDSLFIMKEGTGRQSSLYKTAMCPMRFFLSSISDLLCDEVRPCSGGTSSMD